VKNPAIENHRPDFHRRESDVVIRLLQGVAVCYARIYHQVIVHRPSHLPPRGPAILVCNHTSSLDPLLIQSVCPRLIRWMMAKEYFEVKPMRWIFNTVGVILVERSGRDTAATRAAMRALAEGYVLGVFPEGKIETTDDLLPFQNGIGLLALKTGAPVYPAYLDGTQRGKAMLDAVIRPNKASISFGQPVDLKGIDPSRKGVEEAAGRIQRAVAGLRLEQTLRRPRRQISAII
jgi:1-acyl-sn-glycerol-3-phosphate acyltransferase